MKIINDIIRREGGFVNHSADRGGPTNYGITLKTLETYRGHPVDVEDVRLLTEAEARDIYLTNYVIMPWFDRIDSVPLRSLVIDSGVNHGVKTASKWLQKAAGVTEDGMIGPVSISAVNAADAGKLYREILSSRARFYGSIITRDPTQSAFAAGWMARLAEFIEETP